MLDRTSNSIGRYYDDNTRWFLRFGGSRDTAAIHRKVWGPGVTTPQQAFLYLNELVSDAVRQALAGHLPARVLDLGCGVGGTSTWLAEHLGARVTGITNSPVQAQLAAQRASALGFSLQCQFITADFDALPALDPVQAAVAIESFVHSQDAERFFQQAAVVVEPGGRLVVCDDFLASNNDLHGRSGAWIQRFQSGWHLRNLVTVIQAENLASKVGWRLLEARDLSNDIHPWPRPLLAFVAAVTRLALPWAFWDNLRGGTALQICLREGWTKYYALTWERVK